MSAMTRAMSRLGTRRIAVLGGRDPLTDALLRGLRAVPTLTVCRRTGDATGSCGLGVDAAVYLAASRGRPDLDDAGESFATLAAAGVPEAIVISSAAVHQPDHHHPGMVAEGWAAGRAPRNPIARRWRALEELAVEVLGGRDDLALTVLRPAALAVPGGRDPLVRRLGGRWSAVPPGRDPTVQLLAPDDLARAIVTVLVAGARADARADTRTEDAAVYHVAPRAAVPLRQALRLAGVKRLPVAVGLGRRDGEARAERAYLSHPATVGDAALRALGYAPRRSSAEAAADLAVAAGRRRAPSGRAVRSQLDDRFDDHGLDRAYVAAYGKTLFRFLHDAYWRIELAGTERLPRRGGAVLAGVHRGFMPWDGVMAVHGIVRATGRHPRFLIHPCLVKLPFLCNYMTKLGGMIACRENADRVLERDGLLAIFPEGIRGAFTRYRDAYRLGRFGRGEFVKMALRHRVPIVPFVTVGSAEIFPILGAIRWRPAIRFTEWPFVPVTPTMGLVPLPSKWHTHFLEPVELGARYPPEAADDPALVRRLTARVRQRMQTAIDEMLARRRSIFWGSVLEPRRDPAATGAPA